MTTHYVSTSGNTTGGKLIIFHPKDHGRTASSNMVRAMYDALKAIDRAASREVPYDTPTPEPQPAGDEPANETEVHSNDRVGELITKPRRSEHGNPGGRGNYLLRGCRLGAR